MQIRYWNEIDSYITKEREKKDIRHGNARNLSALKITFLKKIIKDIKYKKEINKNILHDNLKVSDPYNERQTVDIDINVEYKAKKKSRYGSWA